jgi:hypothetical protein
MEKEAEILLHSWLKEQELAKNGRDKQPRRLTDIFTVKPKPCKIKRNQRKDIE